MITQQEEVEDGAVEQVSRGRCEVAVQWERPEGQCREVGVQSQTQRSDVAVQVDLIGASFAKPGSWDVPWRCVSVRAEQPGGGALWHCCLHSPPALLCPSANETKTRTPDQEKDGTLETTLPSMHHSSPNLDQSGLSLPSMPICGDSPSSPSPNTVDCADPAPCAPGASDPAPEAELEALGFMAPLSSDEEEYDEPSSAAEPPVKPRRRRPKTCAPSQTPPTASIRRRNNTARQAGLPLRYQLDYDLESHQRNSANQEPHSSEGAGLGGQDKKRALFLPYYKQSLSLGEFSEFQDVARQQYKKELEGDLCIDPSILSPPGFKHLLPPLSPNDKPRLLPLKLKKVKKKDDSRAAAPSKTRDWSIKNTDVKEELMDEESLELESSDWQKRKTKKTTVERLDEVEVTWREEDVLAPDWSKCQRVGAKRDGDWEESRKDGIWPKKKCTKPRQIFTDLNSVQTEAGVGRGQVKRGPGRPRKTVQIKKEDLKVLDEPEQTFAVRTEDERSSSSEQSVRPRRKTVGPPLRYLLESEDLSARRKKERGPRERMEPGEVPDWHRDVKMEESEEHEGQFEVNGTVEEEEEESKLRLGDVRSSNGGKGGLVKKVQILTSETDSAGSPIEDIQDLFVLRGEDDDQWEPPDGEGDRESANERRRQRREGRDKEERGGIHTDSKRLDGFLVYRDQDTGRVTFISPCFVKLQPLEERGKRGEESNIHCPKTQQILSTWI